jgi:hypothetical protein
LGAWIALRTCGACSFTHSLTYMFLRYSTHTFFNDLDIYMLFSITLFRVGTSASVPSSRLIILHRTP